MSPGGNPGSKHFPQTAKDRFFTRNYATIKYKAFHSNKIQEIKKGLLEQQTRWGRENPANPKKQHYFETNFSLVLLSSGHVTGRQEDRRTGEQKAKRIRGQRTGGQKDRRTKGQYNMRTVGKEDWRI